MILILFIIGVIAVNVGCFALLAYSNKMQGLDDADLLISQMEMLEKVRRNA